MAELAKNMTSDAAGELAGSAMEVSHLHGFLAAGTPALPNRVRQLPRVEIAAPTLVTELENPASIDVHWSTEWTRWDGRAYTESYAVDFNEDESDLVYVLMYSKDGGTQKLMPA